MERLTDEYIFALDKDYESYAECKEKGYSEAFSREQDLKRQLKAHKVLEKQIGMTFEDFYKCVTHNGDSFYIIEKNEDSEDLEVIEVFKEDGSMHFFSNDGFYFSGYAYDTNENYYEVHFTSYGYDLFLNQEEAEKALEERKNEN